MGSFSRRIWLHGVGSLFICYESTVKSSTNVQKLVGSIVWKAISDWDFITEN
jgi:hypothetical protein